MSCYQKVNTLRYAGKVYNVFRFITQGHYVREYDEQKEKKKQNKNREQASRQIQSNCRIAVKYKPGSRYIVGRNFHVHRKKLQTVTFCLTSELSESMHAASLFPNTQTVVNRSHMTPSEGREKFDWSNQKQS